MITSGHPLFQDESAFKSLLNGRRQGQSTVVRLHGAAGNQCVGSLLQRVGHQKLQLSGFVAAPAESQKVISFDIDVRSAEVLENLGSASIGVYPSV